MEPNPYVVPVYRREAPFVPGDIVRYIGTALSHIGAYRENRREGIVVSCRYLPAWGKGKKPGWVARVDWADPAKERRATAARYASYMATSLELVRPIRSGQEGSW